MPKTFHYDTINAAKVEEGAFNVKIRWLITKDIGAKNFAMRLIEIGKNGYTPLHTHNWEHEVFVLGGEGTISDGEVQTQLRSGDVVFVAPNEKHQFKNQGKKSLKFICLIPC